VWQALDAKTSEASTLKEQLKAESTNLKEQLKKVLVSAPTPQGTE
jgi:hypothetical protein